MPHRGLRPALLFKVPTCDNSSSIYLHKTPGLAVAIEGNVNNLFKLGQTTPGMGRCTGGVSGGHRL